MSARHHPSTALLAALAAACSATPAITNTNNFDRASDVAFVCLEVPSIGGEVRVRALDDCRLNTADNSPLPCPGQAQPGATCRLHALVTQSTRGEVAVVDLAVPTGVSFVDNLRAVPGFNAIAVGPFPTDIVADPRPRDPARPDAPPGVVWVATARDRPPGGLPGGGALYRIDPLTLRNAPARLLDTDDGGAIPGAIALDGTPRDIEIDTRDGERLLYATIPETGSLAVLRVNDPRRVPPPSYVPVELPAAACAPDGGVDPDAGADAATARCGRAQPLALAVNPVSHEVYVSDDRSNFVHVFAGTPLAETGLLDLGAPARALVVTPVVRELPARATAPCDPDHCARTQYLYAISARDGAVLAFDLVRRARVRANRFPAAPGAPERAVDATLDSPFRVPIAAPAAALVPIVTTSYNPDAPRTCRDRDPRACATDRPTGDPGLLSGVALGVALRNGTFAIVDVDDLDAPCREITCRSTTTAGAMVTFVAEESNTYRFVRHIPRPRGALTGPPKIENPPSVTFPAASGGRTAGDSALSPAIACGPTRNANETCTATTNFGVELVRAPGAPADAPADPFSARNESWTFTYEGTLPGLDQNGGAFACEREREGGPCVGTRVRLLAPGAAFCARGTIAQDDFRDLVEIVDDPRPGPDVDAGAARCRELFGAAPTPGNRSFAIAEARPDVLLLETSGPVTRDDLLRCYPQATRFRVRAARQWIAAGSRSGFLHRVRAEGGRCVSEIRRDDQLDCLATRVPLAGRAAAPHPCPAGRVCMGPLETGRPPTAAETPIFAGPYYCLQIYPGFNPMATTPAGTSLLVRDMQISFVVRDAYEPAFIATGNLPVSIRYVPATERLYVVDTAQSGLVEFRTNPITRTRVFN